MPRIDQGADVSATPISRRLRIVHFSTVHNQHDTRILYRECASLVRAGHEVFLVICAPEAISIDGVSIIPLKRPRSRLIRMTVTALNGLAKVRRLRPDVVHFHDPELAPWMLLSQERNTRVVFDVHEHVMANVEERAWLPSALRPFIKKVAAMFIRQCMARFHVIFAEDNYVSVYPKPKSYAVIHNYPRLDTFPSSTAARKRDIFTLVYLGSISAQRGILDLLDAVKTLQGRQINVGLLIIGRDDLSGTTLANEIRKRNLMNVEVRGYTPQPEAMTAVSACHIGCAVLHAVKNYKDSYPTKIFEYMGCGIPVITSNFPLYRNVVERSHCGLTIEPANPGVLADAVESLMRDPEALSRMGANGLNAIANEYNWRQEDRVLINFYNRIAD